MRSLSLAWLSVATVLIMFSGSLPLSADPIPPAAASHDPLQPGTFSVAGSAGCTLSWVYDGTGDMEGRVFIGTAAHCVASVGQTVRATGYPDFGRVVLIGDACCTATDWALIEVQPEFIDRVAPWVRGHPGFPTGYTTAADTTVGDPLGFSGYGMGFSSTEVTRENRYGYLVFDSAELYQSHAPTIYGDSGGPAMHVLSGKAIGIVSRLNLGGGFQQGPTVEGILDDAAAAGFTIALRTIATE